MAASASQNSNSEPTQGIGQFYQSEIPTLSESALEVFKKYCGLPDDQIEDHIRNVRERAWKIHPYPCIGRYRFLEFSLSRSPRYHDVLDRLKPDQSLLIDLGCCVGQDIRKLVLDGVSPNKLIGVDLRDEFIELGYDLFLDRGSLSTKFSTADIFDRSKFEEYEGRVDVIHVASFLHLFSWDGQLEAAREISRLLRRSVGSLIVGNQVGTTQPGEYPRRDGSGDTMYRHDGASFERFWNEVGSEFGYEWKIEFEFLQGESNTSSWQGSGDGQDASFMGKFRFSVELVGIKR